MANTYLLLLALCLHAVCGQTTVAVDDDSDAVETELNVAAPVEGEGEDPAVFTLAVNASQHSVLPSNAEGKYFRIVSSQVSSKALTYSGSSLILSPHYGRYYTTQIWTYDRVRGVIRSRYHDNYVMQMSSSNRVVVASFQGGMNQLFEPNYASISSGYWKDYVLETVSGSSATGAAITHATDRGRSHQRWNIQYVAPRFCYIRSRRKNTVWTTTSTSINAKILLRTKVTGDNNQLWWEDRYGRIHSLANGGIVTTGSKGQLYTSRTGAGQTWVKSGLYIHGLHDYPYRRVVGVRANVGPEIDSWPNNGGSSQQWYFDYV